MKHLLIIAFIAFSASSIAQSTYSSMNQDSNPTVKDYDRYKDPTSGYIKQEQEFNENGDPIEDRNSFDSGTYRKEGDYLNKTNSFNDL